jgi:hypothetical protein
MGFSTPGERGVRYYVYDASRGQHVVEDVLGEAFQGALGSVFYGDYYVSSGRQQRCWVHLLRDLHDLKEQHAQDDAVQSWAQGLRALYDRAQTFVKAEPQGQGVKEKLYVALCSEVERPGLLYARAEHA